MQLFLVHHGDAVGPDVDPQRPLSRLGQQHVVRAAEAAAAHATRPAVIWHSGKLRARQTAEAFLLVCHPFAGFFATDDLQPDSSPQLMRDRLRGETRDVMIVGHFPHLPRLGGQALDKDGVLANVALAEGVHGKAGDGRVGAREAEGVVGGFEIDLRSGAGDGEASE